MYTFKLDRTIPKKVTVGHIAHPVTVRNPYNIFKEKSKTEKYKIMILKF